jgi:hypothetical protein
MILETAPLKHADLPRRCPFIGIDRKWLAQGQTDAIDPKRKSRGLFMKKMLSFVGLPFRSVCLTRCCKSNRGVTR